MNPETNHNPENNTCPGDGIKCVCDNLKEAVRAHHVIEADIVSAYPPGSIYFPDLLSHGSIGSGWDGYMRGG